LSPLEGDDVRESDPFLAGGEPAAGAGEAGDHSSTISQNSPRCRSLSGSTRYLEDGDDAAGAEHGSTITAATIGAQFGDPAFQKPNRVQPDRVEDHRGTTAYQREV